MFFQVLRNADITCSRKRKHTQVKTWIKKGKEDNRAKTLKIICEENLAVTLKIKMFENRKTCAAVRLI